MERNEKDHLIGMGLDQKVRHAKAVLREALDKFGPERTALAWTGGKDSTLALWLMRETAREQGVSTLGPIGRLPRALFIDEGDVFDEIYAFVREVREKWGLELAVVQNSDSALKGKRVGDLISVSELGKNTRAELESLDFKESAFTFDPESKAGTHLMKTVVLNEFIETTGTKALVTAIRWDEHEARGGEDFFSPRETPAHTRVHPLLHFTERDVWDLIFERDIPFCPLYAQGYRSLGTRSGTVKASDVPAWDQDLENTPERQGRDPEKEQILAQLRSLGYM
ncbi:MAG: phosphoadenosine phosphosulfate reductase family protein [Thermodesulfobacteriota bacterium]|nr:phosphoadenosine phosphosulfate reductase family protein [Thermodesulfobacteriota bacterium]